MAAATTASSVTLKTVIFVGSARNVVPPWGGDSRLGDRVLAWAKSALAGRVGSLGQDAATIAVAHDVRVVDPLDAFGPNGALSHSGAELKAPTFFVAQDSLPEATKELQRAIKDADCYLIVSPEYNHSIPPALSSLMGHFGGSNYKCKPSGIVTYSPGPFAGMRAAMQIQASERHVPRAGMLARLEAVRPPDGLGLARVRRHAEGSGPSHAAAAPGIADAVGVDGGGDERSAGQDRHILTVEPNGRKNSLR
ncbi:hypothetical protein ACHAWF_011574 [Thalassiosira exigua]